MEINYILVLFITSIDRKGNPALIALNFLWFESISDKIPLELCLLPALAQEATDSEGKQRWRQSISFYVTFENLLISASTHSKLTSPLKSKSHGPTYELVKYTHAFVWTKGRVNRVHYRWADHTAAGGTWSGFPRAQAQVTLETSAASHLFITSLLISHICLALQEVQNFTSPG